MKGSLPTVFGVLTGLSLLVGFLGVLPAGFELIAWLGAGLFACCAATAHDARTGTLSTALLLAGCNAYLLAGKIDTSTKSACNLSEVINCDRVNASDASEINGIPITLIGLAFYLGLFVTGLGKLKPRFHQTNGLFALVSLAYSVWLAYQSTLIGAVCLLCITIYLGNGLLLAAALSGLRDQASAPESDGPSRLFDDVGGVFTSMSFATITATFLAVNTIGYGIYRDATRDELSELALARPKPSPSGTPPAPAPLAEDVLLQLFHAPRGDVTLDGTEYVLGNPDAPYQIVEWADYGCPHCALASEELGSLVQQLPQVQVRFKVFPLTAACNAALERDSGVERCNAAVAAECAGEQGKFYEMNHIIFKNQGYMSDSDLAYMAEQLGLDMTTWSQCLEKEDVRQSVLDDAAAGARAGVMATPTMFLKVPDGNWVELTRGGLSALRLIEHHMDTNTLPPAPPAPPLPF